MKTEIKRVPQYQRMKTELVALCDKLGEFNYPASVREVEYSSHFVELTVNVSERDGISQTVLEMISQTKGFYFMSVLSPDELLFDFDANRLPLISTNSSHVLTQTLN